MYGLTKKPEHKYKHRERAIQAAEFLCIDSILTCIYFFERYLCYTCCCFFLFECVFEAKKAKQLHIIISIFNALLRLNSKTLFSVLFSYWRVNYITHIYKMRCETEKRTNGRKERKKEGKAKRMTESTEKIQKILIQKRIHTNTHKGTHTHLLTLALAHIHTNCDWQKQK